MRAVPRWSSWWTNWLQQQLDDYKKLYLKDREIKNIIIVDDYLSPWAVRKAHERGDGNAMVDSKAFYQLMEALRTRGTTELAKRMDIAEEKVPLVYISTVLTKRIAELMGAALIWAPGVTLCDGIAYEYAEQNKLLRGEHDFAEWILSPAAMNISKRYNGSTRRADTLEHTPPRFLTVEKSPRHGPERAFVSAPGCNLA